MMKKGFGNKSNNEETNVPQWQESPPDGLNEFFRGKNRLSQPCKRNKSPAAEQQVGGLNRAAQNRE
jgi:hypothetical protein